VQFYSPILIVTAVPGLVMAQVVSRRPVTAGPGFAYGSVVHVTFVFDKVALGQDFLRVLWFPLSTSFHRGSPLPYIIW